MTLSLAYQPVRGRRVFQPAALEELARTSCIDPALRSSLTARVAAGRPPAEVLHFNYAASRGIVWWEPAQRFRLTVEAPDLASEVGVCGVQLRPTAPGSYEWSTRDALPEDDLFVVFAR